MTLVRRLTRSIEYLVPSHKPTGPSPLAGKALGKPLQAHTSKMPRYRCPFGNERDTSAVQKKEPKGKHRATAPGKKTIIFPNFPFGSDTY